MSIVLSLTGCRTQEEKMIDVAYSAFEYHRNDLLLDNIDFQGPILKNNIECFKPDTNVVVYAWYYTHENDTFWIYTEIDKQIKKDVSVHFSKNIDVLVENRKKWVLEQAKY
ncbi:hypothetical protein [Flavobacterium suaedae]|uniref:hypothetical protein n=1 Tax=Flavobacterium suaedae TaxID=1767027 RepID=UPI001664E817|nr:hypothetical protein [Flavobacterium suaedae]